MSTLERIQEDTKQSMRDRDREKTAALRMLSAAIKNGEIEAGRSLNQDEEQILLRRQLKQREESAEAFRKAGREEQADKEDTEARVVREYLPAQLSDEELEDIVDAAIQETGATSMRDMGAVMSRAMALSEGRAEGKELSTRVRNRLQ